MRNYVSKVFAGVGVANVNAASVALSALADREIIVFDPDTGDGLVAGSTKIQFAMGTATADEPVLSPIFDKASITISRNEYEALQTKKQTLTVGAVPAAGKSAIFKISYHDNLSIIPNQIKQTVIAVEAVAGETTTTFATKIKDEFNKSVTDGNLFCAVTSAGAVVTFESLVLSTESAYNRIDRPEAVNFEVGAPGANDGKGTYTVATTQALKIGQGSPAKVAWMEDQAQGRRGYSDRRSWNDGKKFVPNAKAGETYDSIVVLSDHVLEGDMQDVRSNPVGVVICSTEATTGLITTDLAVAGITPEVIPPSS